jgi:oxygen-independent coproporphyrinogen-3 oxidase
MFNWVRDRRVPSPDNDVVAEMYELTETMLAEAGFGHYEISNWARQGYPSWHNLVYWRNEPYFGFGCGAHSSYAGRRFSNVTHPREYIRRIQSDADATAEVETIDRTLEMGETMMLGLRLIEEGVQRVRFNDRFGVELDEVYGPIIARLIDQGLLESNDDGLRLMQRGHLLGNRVFAEFLPDRS